MTNNFDRYRQTSIQTAPPEQLIVMLYDGGIRFLEQAKVAMREGKDPSEAIGRSQDIIVELTASLNRSAGEVANNLSRLYDFWINRLFQAQIHKDVAMIDEVSAMMRDLREAWATIAVQQKKSNGGQSPSAALNARG